jgi:ABC-type transport system involved in cytochrome c biogenesis permease subunit
MSDLSGLQPNRIGRWIAFGLILTLLGGVFSLAVKTMLPDREYPEINEYEPWSEEVIETARGLPIHEGGRVKPFETYAGFTLLGMRGDRGLRILGEDGEMIKVGPVEWMLDALFRPELGKQLPSFRVDNSDVFETIGMVGKEKRDRYSYAELEPHLEQLITVSTEFQELKDKGTELSTVQKQTIELAYNIRVYEQLLSYFDFARYGVEFQGFSESGQDDQKLMSVTLGMAPILQQAMSDVPSPDQLPARLSHILQQVHSLANRSARSLVIFPPGDEEKEQWRAAGNLIFEVMVTGEHENPTQAIADIQALEYLMATTISEDKDAFAAAFKKLQGNVEERARARGEYRAVPWELSYNKANWFFRATFLAFVPACLFLVLSWLSPKSTFAKVMTWLVWSFSVAGVAAIVVGTAQRVIITQRPPVTGLYDTIPFITATLIIVAMIAELLTRRRMAIAIAPIVGFTGLVIARLFEYGDASDPNDPLLAVLRSNFWLTTHVLTITFGYAAGFLTAAFGLVYLFMRILKLDGGDKSVRRFITRMTYGCVCFTLFLSLVGTVLGGIWANYSWGRFWGWDPKENGALLIVIWMIFILHARMGGIIREWGTNLCAIFGAVIVTFSWWHVNLLGVGLHAYGFSESRKLAVFIFYGMIGVVILVGFGFAVYDRFNKQGKRQRAGHEPPAIPPETVEA